MLTDNQKHYVIELIKQLSNPSDLEKDILDTIKEISNRSLNFNQAKARIDLNYAKHTEIYLKVNSLPTTVNKPIDQINDTDLRYVLQMQLDFLLEKEWNEKNG